MLQAKGLKKRFGGHAAVDGLDLSVEQGEIRCLIGPNGAGKSTALALLAGNQVASAGSVWFDGVDVTRLAACERARKGISIKFQIPNIFPELSVAQNIKIALSRAYHQAELADQTDKLLDTLELTGRRCDRARVLSHGEKQWLEIGLALAIRPRLLLLDEPTAGMTAAETEKTGKLVLRLRQGGVTIIAVEHDMEFVRQIADTVTVLHLGKVFFGGALNEVLESAEVSDIYFGGGVAQ